MTYNNVHRGDIYMTNLSSTMSNDYKGAVKKGYRPVLVVQNNVGNMYSTTTLVAPISSSERGLCRKRLPTHVVVKADEYGLEKTSVIHTEQCRVIDTNLLSNYIGCLDEEKMCEVDNAIVISFGLINKISA